MFRNMCTFGLSRRSQIDFHEQVLALCGRNISDCPSGQHVPEEALIWNWLGIFLNKELHLLGKWITQQPPYLKCLSIYIKNIQGYMYKNFYSVKCQIRLTTYIWLVWPLVLLILRFPSRLSLNCLALFRKIVSLYDYMSKLSCNFERRQYIQQRDLV